MFDESNEPTDIFAGVDPVDKSAASGSGTSVSEGGSSPSAQVVRSGPPRWLFVLIALVVVGGLVGGGYYFIMSSGEKKSDDMVTDSPDAGGNGAAENPAPQPPSGDIGESGDAMPPQPPDVTDGIIAPELPDVEPSIVPEDEIADDVAAGPATVTTEVVAPTPVPDSEPSLDSDGDGLTDEEEAAIGTDIVNPDTDADDLTDGEEVNIYKTDPLKPDTDGDGYLDGQEVKGGYNPNGEGKLLDVPPSQ